jgi:uncharacterized protein
MSTNSAPTLGNGKICYIEIPCADINRSVNFYTSIFNWKTRRRGDGKIAFDDGVGQVSGTWVTGRKPMTEAGLLIYIMTFDINPVLEKILANGGKIVQPAGSDAPQVTARFSDPDGNVWGLYQQPESY